MDIVLLCQSLPSRLFVSRYVLQPLTSEILDDVIGGTRYSKKQKYQEILARLFPRSLGNDVERRVALGAQKIRQLGFALKRVEHGFALERKADSNIYLVFNEALFAPAGKNISVSYRNLFCPP